MDGGRAGEKQIERVRERVCERECVCVREKDPHVTAGECHVGDRGGGGGKEKETEEENEEKRRRRKRRSGQPGPCAQDACALSVLRPLRAHVILSYGLT